MTGSSESDRVSKVKPSPGVLIESIRKKKRKNRYSCKGYGREQRFTAPVRMVPETVIRLALAELSGTAFGVAVLLHRQVDMRATASPLLAVKLPTALFNACGFTRTDTSRALKQLEKKGLVQVHRRSGHRPTVTVLFHPTIELCDAAEVEELEEEEE